MHPRAPMQATAEGAALTEGDLALQLDVALVQRLLVVAEGEVVAMQHVAPPFQVGDDRIQRLLGRLELAEVALQATAGPRQQGRRV